MQKRIQAIMGTYNHSSTVTTIKGVLDRDYPYLEGVSVFFPDDTNVINPILSKFRIGENPYLPDNFPALGIGVTNNHSISPNERYFTLLDVFFHGGKEFEAQISDASVGTDYNIVFLFKLSKTNHIQKEETHEQKTDK